NDKAHLVRALVDPQHLILLLRCTMEDRRSKLYTLVGAVNEWMNKYGRGTSKEAKKASKYLEYMETYQSLVDADKQAFDLLFKSLPPWGPLESAIKEHENYSFEVAI